MKFRYCTDRLILMVADESMAPLVLDYLNRNRSDFERWDRAFGEECYTIEYQEQALAAEQKLFLRSSGVRYYMFLSEKPDFIIGNISFSYLTEDGGHRCSIGYRIDTEYREQGYAYEAASFLIPLIHESYGTKRIEADILEENIPSKKLIEKLGFEYEGIARKSHTIAGVERDHLRYSLIL
jgi:ribosomal-protein-alanine N-acetyltransferase